MASVHILCSVEETTEKPFAQRDLERLRQAAEADSIKTHRLVDDPAAADVVLFVGPGKVWQLDVLLHPVMKSMPAKCFVIDANDRTLPVVQGIYASAERTWLPRSRFRGGFYFRVWENDAVQFSELGATSPLLYSFIGAGANSKVRQKLLRLKHPRAVLLDTSEIPVRERQRDGSTKDEYAARYATTMGQSKFILCPRGLGTSSWRLFEAMKAGRVPVIISDAWVPPEGPDWESFSLRVPEAALEALPALLEQYEPRAPLMGKKARSAWEAHFSKNVAFHRVVETCLAIGSQRRTNLDLGRVLLIPHLLRPFFFRHWVLHLLKSLLIRARSIVPTYRS